MLCLSCGAPAGRNDRFCSSCGTLIAWDCGACGSRNPGRSAYCGNCGTRAPLAPSTEHALAHTVSVFEHATDRRIITAVFADIVGSTALSLRLDPEDLQQLVASHHRCVANEVDRLGGVVARYIGDGVAAYFGYPQTREDDAERAVLAGFNIVRAVDRLETIIGPPGTLRTRIGIASGLVIVSDPIGMGPSKDIAFGYTPNFAARLQSIAEAGTVVICDTTKAQIGSLFECRQIDAVNLKGIPSPQRAWVVLAEDASDDRFKALRSVRAPLVGRRGEIEFLKLQWLEATAGHGKTVLITGEAGIGKSRLIAELEERLAGETLELLSFMCSPQHRSTAFYPVIRALQRRAGMQPSDSLDERRRKLSAFVHAYPAAAEDVETLADLLSIPLEHRSATTFASPQRRRDMAFDFLRRHIESLAARMPVLLVVEDTHWADPTTLEFLEAMTEWLENSPMFAILTTRPEYQPSWAGRAGISSQVITGLGRRASKDLVEALAGDANLPQAVVDRIITRSDGVPLYIEELTRAVLDRTSDAVPSRRSRTEDSVPLSLQASLSGRLDALAHAKTIAQIASAIGKDFTKNLLEAVANCREDELAVGIESLVRGGVLVSRGSPSNEMYSFKHALIQDAAYSSMLREQRRAVHEALADKFTRHTDKLGNVEAEVLAWHYAEAGMPRQSSHCYLLAAQQAGERVALSETVAHLQNGLEQCTLWGDSAAALAHELKMQLLLGRALVDSSGSGHEQVRKTYQRAQELCLRLGDVSDLLRVHDGLGNHYFTRSDSERLLQSASELQVLSESGSHPHAGLMALRARALGHFIQGQLFESCGAVERLLAGYDPDRDGPHASLTSRDMRVAMGSILGIARTVLGYAADGRSACDQAIAHAEHKGHIISLVVALRRACVQAMVLRDATRVVMIAERLVSVSAEYETYLGSREGKFFLWWGQSWLDLRPDRAVDIENCLSELMQAKHFIMLPFFLSCAAELLVRIGQHAAASRMLDQADELTCRAKEWWSWPEVLRVKAVLSAHNGEVTTKLLRGALDAARAHDMRLWELRAANALAAAMMERGEQQPALDILRPLHDWFCSRDEFGDLAVTRKLLAAESGQATSRDAGGASA
jgi:class 3 adenylate cyclase